MARPQFRHPREMTVEENRLPVSARVKTSTKETLERFAKESGLSLSQLMANVLDDYAAWLHDAGGKKK